MKVAFIAGAPRSGSTLLALALAERPDHVTVGELSFLWEKGVIGNQLCGCGAPFLECEFWTAVGEVAFGGWENANPPAMVKLRSSVDKARYVPLVFVPWLAPGFRRRTGQYVAVLERVYEAVSRVSECDVVIDSSKTPTAALMLRYLERVEPTVVHILRDSRGVAYSWSKRKVVRPEFDRTVRYMNTFSAPRTSALWLWHNLPLHCCRVYRLPRTQVRYEDMATELDAQLARLDGGVMAAAPKNGGHQATLELNTHHTISGNRVRFATHLNVTLDDEWRTKLPRRSKFVVTLLTAPLLYAYGYLGAADSVVGGVGA